jgi:hypothetical protein
VPSEITQLDYPIDVMSLIHKAIRAEARLTRRAAEQLEMGGNFKSFMQVFYRWAMALEYHEETEYKYIIPYLPHSPPARHNEIGHKELLEGLEELQICLHEELGRTMVIPRTQRQLFGKVIALLIVQADLLEEEEENVLPAIRLQIGEDQQLEMARRLLFDLDADEPHWVLDWVAEHLTDTERRVLAKFAVRLDEPSYSLSSLLAESAGAHNEASTSTAGCESVAVAEKTALDHPIDVMFLLHKALSVDAWRTEAIAERLVIGEDLQPFQHAFDSWMQALNFHAAMEDVYMTPLLPESPQARDNEAAHTRLEQRAEQIRTYLQEVGHQAVTARMRRRLFGQVVALRIEQDDHLEEEEEFILPIIREHFSPEEQLEIVAHLLLDPKVRDEASSWVLDWLRQDLTDVERQSLASLTARLPG